MIEKDAGHEPVFFCALMHQRIKSENFFWEAGRSFVYRSRRKERRRKDLVMYYFLIINLFKV